MIPYSLKMILTGYSDIIFTQNDIDRAPIFSQNDIDRALVLPYSLKMILTGSSDTIFT